MLVISGRLILNPVTVPQTDLPLIGWQNIIAPESIVASGEQDNWPASNLANPLTHLEWRGLDTSEQYLTISSDQAEPVDYIGIAKHNFASAEIPVSIEIFDSANDEWVEVVADIMPGDDSPLVFRFPLQSVSQIRIRMQAGIAPPRAAVVYLGKMLVLERKVYVGHTPLPYGRRSEVSGGRSIKGNFLGSIVLGEWRETTVPLSLISPGWFRANMVDFLAVCKDTPFFFAWRPDTYPAEVGFGVVTNDPDPKPTAPSNKIAFDLAISGVA